LVCPGFFGLVLSALLGLISDCVECNGARYWCLIDGSWWSIEEIKSPCTCGGFGGISCKRQHYTFFGASCPAPVRLAALQNPQPNPILPAPRLHLPLPIASTEYLQEDRKPCCFSDFDDSFRGGCCLQFLLKAGVSFDLL